jgi:acyl carrier protein
VDNPDLHHQLVSILADVFQVELPASLEDVTQDELEEWDSFNHLRLVSDLEDIFQITIDDEDIPDMTSLKQVKALLQRHGANSVDGTDPMSQ